MSLPVAASTPSIIIQHGADLSCVKQPKPLVAEGDELEDAWSDGTISELDRAIVLHSSRASSNVITNTRVGEAGNCTINFTMADMVSAANFCGELEWNNFLRV